MKAGQHLSIRRKHTAAEAGRALLAMGHTISEDGRPTDEAALDLHRWLTFTVAGYLPAPVSSGAYSPGNLRTAPDRGRATKEGGAWHAKTVRAVLRRAV